VLGGQTGQATIVVIYAMIGVSLVILTGWAGQISLGQYAIAAIGAAAAGGLAANHRWDFFVTLAAGALAGAVLAVFVGLPALRIQGMFLAVTTLAFAFAVQALLTREYVGWLLPEPGRLVNRPVLWGRLDLEAASDLGPLHISADAKFYYLCMIFLVLTLALGRSFRNNRSGRVLITVRDNPQMAQSFGVNLAASRLAAFAISGLIAGLAGALLAYQNRAIASNAFPPERSIEIFVLTVIGGVGSLPGALLGAVYVRVLPLLPGLRDIDSISLLTSGLGLLVLLSFMPGGLGEGFYRGRDRWLRRIAKRRDIHVPSLVADSLVVESTASNDALSAAFSEKPVRSKTAELTPIDTFP
jgi:branched-chain amino acid transport system permease protein